MRKEKALMFKRLTAALVLMSSSFMEPRASAQETQTDYTSRVPKFKFADTLEEQEEQLKTNPLVLRFARSRKKMSGERYRVILCS